MNKKILILPVIVAGLGLASCSKGNATADQTIKVTASKGTAAVALAGKVSSGTVKFVNSNAKAAIDLNGSSEVVVTDAAIGLHKLVEYKTSAYGVTRMVSKNSDMLLAFSGSSAIASDSVILSYSKGSASDLAFRKLCEDFWHVSPTIKYVENVKELLKVFETGTVDGQSVDFSVCPWATAYELDSNSEKYSVSGTYSFVETLNNYWSTYTESLEGVEKQEFIPGLVTVVSKDAANKKTTGLEGFYSELNAGIDNAVEHTDRLEAVMKGYSLDDAQQVEMFGSTTATIAMAKTDGNTNIYGLAKGDEVPGVQACLGNFMSLIDSETTDYTNCYFEEAK